MPKIMIVDDDTEIASLVEATLTRDDYEIIKAHNGQDAVAQAKAQHPDLILMDVMMPKKDGYTACREIRADPETADIRIVMLTSMGGEEQVRKGFEAGADGYMVKPFSPVALITKVHEMLEPSRDLHQE
jgi:DNA-binding response OmpR family regulator